MKLVIDLDRIAAIRASKGWDAPAAHNIDQKLLMAVGEICEAQEHLRDGRRVDEIFYAMLQNPGEVDGPIDQPKPDGVPIELCDAVIRLLDILFATCPDVQYVFDVKIEYNEQRAKYHGGRRF